MWRVLVLSLVASTSAQIPLLGWCADYQPMSNFNMNRFLGTWYETERYFTVSELGTRCVTTHYTATPEGRILVTNEITNSLTGFKRLMEGHLQMVGRDGEGRVLVKYSSTPLPYDFEYSILDTDYDSYAVMWSCSGIGPVHTQNIWLLSRDRLPSSSVMQNAYNVLEKFKISRTFFLKTNQADCTVLPEPVVESIIASKSAAVPDEVPEVDKEKPVEKHVDAVVKSIEIKERTAVPEPQESIKPIQVPELIMSESEKKEDKTEQPKESTKSQESAKSQESVKKEEPL